MRLTVNGKTSTAPLTVKMDPRVMRHLPAIEEQFTLEMRLASELTASTEATTEAHSVLDQLHKLEANLGLFAESIKALDQKVKTIAGDETICCRRGAGTDVCLAKAAP